MENKTVCFILCHQTYPIDRNWLRSYYDMKEAIKEYVLLVKTGKCIEDVLQIHTIRLSEEGRDVEKSIVNRAYIWRIAFDLKEELVPQLIIEKA